MTTRIEHSPLTVCGRLCTRIDRIDRWATAHETQIRRIRLLIHALWITIWAIVALTLAGKEGVNLYEHFRHLDPWEVRLGALGFADALRSMFLETLELIAKDE